MAVSRNRIVVDYHGARKLVLLGVIRTANGVELSLEDFSHLGFELPRRYEVPDLESLPRDTQNFEGYVVRFENGLRVKVKLDDYVRLHKLMTGITPNRIWEMLASGQDVRAAIAELPDEMYDEVLAVTEAIEAESVSLFLLHSLALNNLNLGDMSRKEQAAKILDLCRRSQSEPVVGEYVIPLNSAILFMMLDGQADWAKKKMWNLVKPQNGNKLICKVDAEG